MIITEINIDGSNYYNYLVEESSKFIFQIEDGLNNPSSSIFECKLWNTLSLQNIFLKTNPYDVGSPGYCIIKIIEYEDSPFGSEIIIYKGYLDKDNIPNNIYNKILDIRIIGIEKHYTEKLNQYDITQIFYETGDYSTSQRGGRLSSASRLDYTLFHKIEDIIYIILSDMGFASNDIVISISNSDSFNYKYDVETYGDITNVKSTIKRLRNNYMQRLSDMVSSKQPKYTDITDSNNSYSKLIREFASLTGCVWFYNHRDSKFYFVDRNYNWNVDIDAADILYDEERKGTYYEPYNGMILTFKDIIISIKRTISYPSLTETNSYNFQVNNGTDDNITQTLVNGTTYYIKNGDTYLYVLGTQKADDSMYISNPLEIQFTDNLSSYIQNGYGGTSIEPFLDKIMENNKTILDKYIDHEIETKGTYRPPFNFAYNGETTQIYNSEIDVYNNKTILGFSSK